MQSNDKEKRRVRQQERKNACLCARERRTYPDISKNDRSNDRARKASDTNDCERHMAYTHCSSFLYLSLLALGGPARLFLPILRLALATHIYVLRFCSDSNFPFPTPRRDTEPSHAHTLRRLSHDPVQSASPLPLTPRHDTRFSWPVSAYAGAFPSESASQARHW